MFPGVSINFPHVPMTCWGVLKARRCCAYIQDMFSRDRINDIVREGSSTKELAVSVAFGFAGGVFPLVFATSFVVLYLTNRCTVPVRLQSGQPFRVNKLLAQLVNLLVFPLNLVTLPIYVKCGFAVRLLFTSNEDIGRVRQFLAGGFFAIFVWLLSLPAVILVVTLLFIPLIMFTKSVRKIRSRSVRERLVSDGAMLSDDMITADLASHTGEINFTNPQSPIEDFPSELELELASSEREYSRLSIEDTLSPEDIRRNLQDEIDDKLQQQNEEC